MKSKIVQSVIAGLVATAVMTGFMFLAPLMGLPKMNPAEMLSSMLGVSLTAGYLMHGMIGIIFAVVYVYFFNSKVHIHSKIVKGALYGFVVFVFAQMMMFVMEKMMNMPMGNDSMMLMMLGSLIGHLVFGIVLGLLVPAQVFVGTHNNFRNAQA